MGGSARDQNGQPDLSVKEISINYLFTGKPIRLPNHLCRAPRPKAEELQE